MTYSTSDFQPHESEPSSEATTLAPGITLAAMPLGNTVDASDHLRGALIDADITTAEDAWWACNLAAALGISPRGESISSFNHNEDSRTESLTRAAKAEQRVIVVTNARMPVVSDPDLVVVATAHDTGVPVSCIPGPNAVTTALAFSDLNVGHFRLNGFAPRKQGTYRARLESLKIEERVCCFFESPHRLAVTLVDVAGILGEERRASVGRESAKRFGETRRATLGELVTWAEEGVRGEITVAAEGAGQQAVGVSTKDLADRVGDLVADGMQLKDAMKQIVVGTEMTKHRNLYQAVLAVREENHQVIVTLCQKTSRYTTVNRVNAIIGSFCNPGKNEGNLRKPTF